MVQEQQPGQPVRPVHGGPMAGGVEAEAMAAGPGEDDRRRQEDPPKLFSGISRVVVVVVKSRI